MKPEIITTIISSLVALITAIFTAIYAKSTKSKFEKWKMEIEEKSKENDAMRDYRYEAKKRLYSEYEPMFFQFTEHAELALKRIISLARAEKLNNLGPKGWMFDEYYFSSTLYRLLAPLAIYKIIVEKLTFIDLSLDKRIFFEYSLMKMLYSTFTDDFKIAKSGDMEYKPLVEDWKEKRIENEPEYWRQGIPMGHLETSINALIVERSHIMSFHEFRTTYYSDENYKNRFNAISDIFFNFRPSHRPVLWSILMVQAILYNSFVTYKNQKNHDDEILLSETICNSFDKEQDVAWLHQYESDNFKMVVDRYLKEKIKKVCSNK